MSRRFYIAGLVFGVVAVILGAFAAHGLKPLLTVDAMLTFETGVRYQMYHALLFLLIGNMRVNPAPVFKWIFYLLIIGIFFFSGSIYLLATNDLTSWNFKFLGPVTPVGGSLLIFCWILLLSYFIKLKNK
ncbi:DUF423 domain-containing protein [Antarcticibacterium flavum]|uniref:DUF423 domain-containing protein n=1 Tax=Antarcticibacterium flavum TaxID=2058175 RepID=A0A5B7X342_9FLAO|nr:MULTISPECIES: DUF423 domain-containing protein [Antarcticibacterium]MCM4159436.1 DUF423 domain-containing protein [Antarcticibacterium sp. W02-3]QCY69926.1 DUF423 domain-containing protein [Antarcticibacterium flavum]